MKQTIPSFVKAVGCITMGRVNRDFVAKVLEANRCIDDQAFGAANAQIGMKKDDALCVGHFVEAKCASLRSLKVENYIYVFMRERWHK